MSQRSCVVGIHDETASPIQAQQAPVVSVCIANWNCREMLRACLRSLEQDQGVAVEVIVVDNASTDGAADTVASEFPKVRLIRNAVNKGFAIANNQAAAIARGEYLLFLNNDTLVPHETLAKLQAFHEDHPQAILVGPRLREPTGKIQTSFRRQPTIATFLHRTWVLGWTRLFRRNYEAYRRMKLDASQAHSVDVLMGAALMVHRDRFQDLGGWDERFRFGGEDLDLCHRAHTFGEVMYVPQVEIIHYGRVSTRRHASFAATQVAIGFVQYFRKTGASRLGLVVYKLAVTFDAPLRILVRGIQYLTCRLRGKHGKADRCLTEMRALVPFVARGLIPFWRA